MQAQHPVAAALQRHVEVRRDRRRRRQDLEHVLGEVRGQHARTASASAAGAPATSRSSSAARLDARREVGAPVAEVHAGEHDLRMAGLHEPSHLLLDDLRCQAAAGAARERHDAERAPVLAAVLDLDEGARATFDAARLRPARAGAAAMSPTSILGAPRPVRQQRRDQVGQPRLVGIAHDQIHAASPPPQRDSSAPSSR